MANEREALEVLSRILTATIETRNTRNSGLSSETKVEPFDINKTDSKGNKTTVVDPGFTYKSIDGKKFYKHEQFDTKFKFDCESLLELEPIDGLNQLIKTLVDQLIIIDQRCRSSLSESAFTEKYSKDVTVNVRDITTKSIGKTASPDKIQKQAMKLTSEERLETLKKIAASLNMTVDEAIASAK